MGEPLQQDVFNEWRRSYDRDMDQIRGFMQQQIEINSKLSERVVVVETRQVDGEKAAVRSRTIFGLIIAAVGTASALASRFFGGGN
jgi:hypothetical protein